MPVYQKLQDSRESEKDNYKINISESSLKID